MFNVRLWNRRFRTIVDPFGAPVRNDAFIVLHLMVVCREFVRFFDVFMWMPGSGDSIDQSVDTVYIPAFADYGISEEAITDAELGINFDIYTVNNGKEDINIARHEGWLINYEVELRDGKWYQVFDTGSQGGLGSSHGGATGANRIHDSFINAGRGNDVVFKPRIQVMTAAAAAPLRP